MKNPDPGVGVFLFGKVAASGSVVSLFYEAYSPVGRIKTTSGGVCWTMAKVSEL